VEIPTSSQAANNNTPKVPRSPNTARTEAATTAALQISIPNKTSLMPWVNLNLEIKGITTLSLNNLVISKITAVSSTGIEAVVAVVLAAVDLKVNKGSHPTTITKDSKTIHSLTTTLLKQSSSRFQGPCPCLNFLQLLCSKYHSSSSSSLCSATQQLTWVLSQILLLQIRESRWSETLSMHLLNRGSVSSLRLKWLEWCSTRAQ